MSDEVNFVPEKPIASGMSSVIVTSTETGALLHYREFDGKWKSWGVLRVLREWAGPGACIRFQPAFPNWLRREVAAELGHSCHLPEKKGLW